jgi:DegV family protein with EDD domain
VTIGIVTDSTTCLPEGVGERPELRVVPLTFSFGPEESYLDKVDLTNEQFFEKLANADKFPTTAAPSPGAFAEAYESLSAYDDILVLTISGKLSGTYNSAAQAVDLVERPVVVLDTLSAEMGSGLILAETLRCLDEGGSFEEVRATAEDAIRRCTLFFAVGTLEYLQKNGRIGRAQRLLGTALDVRPVLGVENGEVVPHKRARGRRRQMAAIVEEARPAAEEGRPVAFGHVAAPEQLARLKAELGTEGVFTAEIGGVVGSHVGPGAYGVAYL